MKSKTPVIRPNRQYIISVNDDTQIHLERTPDKKQSYNIYIYDTVLKMKNFVCSMISNKYVNAVPQQLNEFFKITKKYKHVPYRIGVFRTEHLRSDYDLEEMLS